MNDFFTLIRQRVYQYGFALLFSRGISFLFTIWVVRSLPLADTGTFYYLVGISAFVEIVITWGMPVSLQTMSGKVTSSNLALSSTAVSFFLCILLFLLFSTADFFTPEDWKLNLFFKTFVFFSALGNSVTSVSLAHYRSLGQSKTDIFIMIGRELVKIILLLIVIYSSLFSLDSALLLLIGINAGSIILIVFSFAKNADHQVFSIKDDSRFLIENGILLMLTFLVYSFPSVFVKVFGYLNIGKEAAGIVNVVLLTNAAFLLYANAWGMAIKPLVGQAVNMEYKESAEKIWQKAFLVYLTGCAVLFALCLIFLNPILNVLKLDSDSASIKRLFLIILFFNWVFSIGSLNNSFLQMLKLTKREIRGMAFGLLLYPVVIFICLFFANMHVLAVSLVVFELFKILVQEIILHKYADFSTRKAAGQKSILIITGGFVLLAYGWYFSIL